MDQHSAFLDCYKYDLTMLISTPSQLNTVSSYFVSETIITQQYADNLMASGVVEGWLQLLGYMTMYVGHQPPHRREDVLLQIFSALAKSRLWGTSRMRMKFVQHMERKFIQFVMNNNY